MLNDDQLSLVVRAVGESAVTLEYRPGSGESAHGEQMLALARQIEAARIQLSASFTRRVI